MAKHKPITAENVQERCARYVRKRGRNAHPRLVGREAIAGLMVVEFVESAAAGQGFRLYSAYANAVRGYCGRTGAKIDRSIAMNGMAIGDLGESIAPTDTPMDEWREEIGAILVDAMGAVKGERAADMFWRYTVAGERPAKIGAAWERTGGRVSQIVAQAREILARRLKDDIYFRTEA